MSNLSVPTSSGELPRLKIWVLGLIEEYFSALKNHGVVGKALSGERGETTRFEFEFVNIRDYSIGNYKSVDDTPYGGGPGMVLRADVLEQALIEGVLKPLKKTHPDCEPPPIVFTSPEGKVWSHQEAVLLKEQLEGEKQEHIDTDIEVRNIVFICGRYEGIDQRFIDRYVTQIYSLGDFVLSGGEIPVLAIIDSLLRLYPGVLGNSQSAVEDSFSGEGGQRLDFPHYTRPRVWNEMEVPAVLLEGHHKKIEEWKQSQSLQRTQSFREDLL